VDCVSERMLRMMKDAGFKYLELGVESGDPDVLSRSGKGVNLEQIKKAVKIAKREGIKIWCKFIIGLPGETKETVRKTINTSVKLNPHRISVATIVAYPGCKIYEWAMENKNGYRLLSTDWNRFDKYLSSSLELESLSHSTMRRFQYQMYLETYIRNFRLLELLRMVWAKKYFFLSLGRSMLTSRFTR
jgi:radical SAM superfamily enzyme YgiQ (UPF0313 family)